MMADSFRDSFHAVVSLVLGCLFLLNSGFESLKLAGCVECHACMRQTPLTHSEVPGFGIAWSDFS